MAVFEQRESGWWQAKIRRKGFPSQSKTFRTKLDAQVWARAIESGIDKGTHVSTVVAENTLFKELAARFSTEFAPFHYRGMGWKHKLAHLVDHFGSHSVASLTADKIASIVISDLPTLTHGFQTPIRHREFPVRPSRLNWICFQKCLTWRARNSGSPYQLATPLR
jgi:hypothetical protein